jgi:hypothetical protein
VVGDGIFTYWVTSPSDYPAITIWLLVHFDAFPVVATVSPKGRPDAPTG